MDHLEAFNKIYKKNYPSLHRIACKMLNDGDAAADKVQDVFIYLHEKMQSGYQLEYPRTWLSRAVFYKCVDHLRKKKRDVRIDTIQNISSEDNPIEKNQSAEIVNLALEKLKYKEKMLAVLYSEGYSYKEMSDSTGIRLTSVGGTLSRILKKMKKELIKLGYEMH